MNANDEHRRLAIHELNFTKEGLAIEVDGGCAHRFLFFFAIRSPKPPVSSSSMN
jgi:hypothetical protein